MPVKLHETPAIDHETLTKEAFANIAKELAKIANESPMTKKEADEISRRST